MAGIAAVIFLVKTVIKIPLKKRVIGTGLIRTTLLCFVVVRLV